MTALMGRVGMPGGGEPGGDIAISLRDLHEQPRGRREVDATVICGGGWLRASIVSRRSRISVMWSAWMWMAN